MAKPNVCKAIQEHWERQELPPHRLKLQEKLLRALEKPQELRTTHSPAEEGSKPKSIHTTGGNHFIT